MLRAMKSIFASILALVVAGGATAELRIDPVYEGCSGLTFVTHAGDGSGRLFIVEQRGVIRVIRQGTLLATPFLDIQGPVTCCSERGLLGLAFDPDFAANGRFYVNYTTTISSQLTTRVSRFTVSPPGADVADSTTEQTIIEYSQPANNHNGGWIDFGPDGYLYIASGDGGSGGDPWGATGNGQNRNTVLGKILRLDVSGQGTGYTVPATNPFFNTPGTRAEIWAYGLRNPWRCSFDRNTGDLYIADVGQGAVEEVNFQPANVTVARNYGWKVMEGDACHDGDQDGGNPPCNDPSFTPPVHTYRHDDVDGCSVTGGYVYRGNKMPYLRGRYFFADYCARTIWSFRMNGGVMTDLVEHSEINPGTNITSFGEDEAGELYVVTSLSVYKISDRIHRADVNGDSLLNLSEVLRVVQFFNATRYACADTETEDGYQPGNGSIACGRHTADYEDPQGNISLSELLRVIQLYSLGAYVPCPGDSEDNLCPAAG
jgi:glucose/arabinose dehydrogenase